MSEKLIGSDWDNNHSGAVRALNAVGQRPAAMIREKDVPAFLFGNRISSVRGSINVFNQTLAGAIPSSAPRTNRTSIVHLSSLSSAGSTVTNRRSVISSVTYNTRTGSANSRFAPKTRMI